MRHWCASAKRRGAGICRLVGGWSVGWGRGSGRAAKSRWDDFCCELLLSDTSFHAPIFSLGASVGASVLCVEWRHHPRAVGRKFHRQVVRGSERSERKNLPTLLLHFPSRRVRHRQYRVPPHPHHDHKSKDQAADPIDSYLRVGENRGNVEAARALDVHEEAVRRLNEPLQLVFPLLVRRQRLQEVSRHCLMKAQNVEQPAQSKTQTWENKGQRKKAKEGTGR